MRNLKKFLALAMAMVMSLSLMATVNAADTVNLKFPDASSITSNYETAVAVLNGINVFKGRDTGNFDPKGEINRAEVTAIIYRMVTGDVEDKNVNLYKDYAYTQFNDVTADKWFVGYVGYCANAQYVKGRDATTFDPDGKVTGYEVLAMILRAIGYDQNGEFTGESWQVKVASTASQLGLLSNMPSDAAPLGTKATREVVAELLFQAAVKTPTVQYLASLNVYNPYRGIFSGVTTDWNASSSSSRSDYRDTLAYRTFGLLQNSDSDFNTDDWGRPRASWNKYSKYKDHLNDGSCWTAKGDKEVVTFNMTPTFKITERVSECDVTHAFGDKDLWIESAWIDGTEFSKDKYNDLKENGSSDDFKAYQKTYAMMSEEVTTEGKRTPSDSNYKIEKLKTDSFMGAQGRLMQVYDLGYEEDGKPAVRVVEINTYLAKVTRVIAGYTDKNGHPVNRKLEVEVYTDTTANGTSKGFDASSIKLDSSYNLDDIMHKWDGDKNVNGEAQVKYIKETIENDNEDIKVGTYLTLNMYRDGTYADQDARREWKDGSDTVNGYKVEKDSVAVADIQAVGIQSRYTRVPYVREEEAIRNDKAAVIRLGGHDYNCADKFFLGLDDEGPFAQRSWDAALDANGNILGLIESVTNYLVIEEIAWLNQTSSLRGGNAYANVILSDGTELDDVVVSSINDRNIYQVSGNADGDPAEYTVNDAPRNNTKYYGHIIGYDVKSDGTYNLIHNSNGDCDWSGASKVVYDANNVTITKKSTRIWNNTESETEVYVNDSTIFLVPNGKYVDRNITYKQVVGKNNVSDYTGSICYLKDSQNYAKIVILQEDKEDNITTFEAYYKPADNGTDYVDTRYVQGEQYYGFEVYKVGDTEPTMVWHTEKHLPLYVYAISNDTNPYVDRVDDNADKVGVSEEGTIKLLSELDNAEAVKEAGGIYYFRVSGGYLQKLNETVNGDVTLKDKKAVLALNLFYELGEKGREVFSTGLRDRDWDNINNDDWNNQYQLLKKDGRRWDAVKVSENDGHTLIATGLYRENFYNYADYVDADGKAVSKGKLKEYWMDDAKWFDITIDKYNGAVESVVEVDNVRDITDNDLVIIGFKKADDNVAKDYNKVDYIYRIIED